ncbi:two-component system CheB/CheR fusion protein [Nocardia tenerifensis]|uniref:protein-glutamate O-methyltransferase n=1 Tax=Nocardia tenerifensis TaxID=228006 RepID=A0A318KH91_9NOCA|nr:CheR family methyltransferase [Nocardia tenerifensis]PXX71632.1 two-component system CheB/CheR fusion protein [Nocardia tenerifensis]
MTDPGEQTPVDPNGDADSALEDLLIFIRDSRGFDFTGYKRTSLRRRIRKRMAEVRIADYHDYRDHLESNSDEFRSLFNTILINVTNFFRDVDAWHYLQRDILPELLSRIKPSDEIRVWSAGCSSGEEAYSLAIAFAEALGIEEAVARVKIYGTDVDEEALRDARAGMYTAKALEPLSGELRSRYFEPNGDKFVFRPDLRRRVIFGRHDIGRDAPISRLDLLVCRNTLMYFNVEAQSHILDRYHFALREGGFLFLGKAEMLLSDGERFEVANMRQRMFRRREGDSVPLPPPGSPRLDIGAGQEVQGFVRRRLLNELALETVPFAVIGLDTEGRVAVLNSQVRHQFGLTTYDIGRPLSDLEISYRPVELRSLIEQALAERRTIRVNSVERPVGADETQFYDVQVQPLWTGDGTYVGVVINFVDTTVSTRLSHEVKVNREELETAYEELQSTNEELETTNEELQSSIEELETTNEELQSTNEELETTNEELQSGNEELETMNEELRIRSNELDETKTFLEGILSSIAAGVVVLNGDLRVRSWNRGAEELWGLRADEVRKQYFNSLDFGLPTEELRDTIEECLRSGRRSGPVHVPAVNRIGRSIVCLVTCTPLDGPREGVVLLMEEGI